VNYVNHSRTIFKPDGCATPSVRSLCCAPPDIKLAAALFRGGNFRATRTTVYSELLGATGGY